MKPIFERLAPLANTEIVACEKVIGDDFHCQWHFHPEVELTLVEKGGTHRWIGDKISAIEEGDLVMIGPNLPHDFRNEVSPGMPAKKVHAIVIQFHPDFLGSTWLDRNGMHQVQRLFQLATHGIQIKGATRTKVTNLMKKAVKLEGIQRLIVILEILAIMSESKEIVEIASPGFTPEIQVSDKARMSQVASYIEQHIEYPIYLSEVADHVGMTKVTFSRYFRSRTGKTFPAYLNELRVARVCRLLAETDATVSEIALNCGFDSMANFEKQFFRLQACSPKAYRQKALRILPGTSRHSALSQRSQSDRNESVISA